MFAQAHAELPNECCGLLAGLLSPDGTAHAVKRYPLVNAAASPVEYLSEPRSLLHAMRDMREQGLDLLAIYHSHPTSDPVPSRKDRENNFYGDSCVHLIISLKQDESVMRGWWLTGDGHREAEWEVLGGSEP
jgi:proteasome lid subunit RPN8/RPN11